MTSASIRVLLVDDFEPFRRLAFSILKGRPEFKVVGEGSDGLDAVQKAHDLQPDLVLLDIGLPKLNGIEVGRRIREQSPASKILFLSQESSPEVIREALALGAQGYLLKSHARRDLLSALIAVLQGGQFLNVPSPEF